MFKNTLCLLVALVFLNFNGCSREKPVKNVTIPKNSEAYMLDFEGDGDLDILIGIDKENAILYENRDGEFYKSSNPVKIPKGEYYEFDPDKPLQQNNNS
jgi:hypothetical protein